jgi:hypothetical protein
VASSGVKNSGTTENEWGQGASVLEDRRGTLECSEAVSGQNNTREAECLGEDTRLVCITGYLANSSCQDGALLKLWDICPDGDLDGCFLAV